MPVNETMAPVHNRLALVLQGGGALGAYQAGVFEALDTHGMIPDWVAGTSIGALNAALIAGNAPEERVNRLQTFWRLISHRLPPPLWPIAWNPFDARPQESQSLLNSMAAIALGQNGFFRPHMTGPFAPGLYDATPLRDTLADLIDFERLNTSPIRFTAGAVSVTRGNMVYFDNRNETIRLEHIMASAALPPAFAPVRVDDGLYWDGGITSNTPIEGILDPADRESTLCFMVNLWNEAGEAPHTLPETLTREKEIRYSSRFRHEVEAFRQRHELRRAVRALYKALPETTRRRPEFQRLAALGCHTRMDLVRLADIGNYGEPATKDADFESTRLRNRWSRGYRDAAKVLEQAPWQHAAPSDQGVVLHDIPAQTESENGDGAHVPPKPERTAQ